MSNSNVVSCLFVDSNALSNSHFIALLDHAIPYKPHSCTDSQKVDLYEGFNEESTVANITMIELEEIRKNIGKIRLFLIVLDLPPNQLRTKTIFLN